MARAAHAPEAAGSAKQPRSTRSERHGPANGPRGAQVVATLRAEIQALADRRAVEPEPGRHATTRHALDYLAGQSLIHFFPPAPLDPAAAAKLCDAQADLTADLFRVMLDGIDITDEQYMAALDAGIAHLKASSVDGWEPA